MATKKKQSSRIMALDIMRGYLIFVIIADHLVRWPSPLAWLTGQGRLWVSAAEGFFIISGLLVGYTKGFKLRKQPMREIFKKTWSRALLLYAVSAVTSFILMLVLVRVKIPSGLGLPLPSDTSTGSLIWLSVSQLRVTEWIYFLRLYWIVLLISPLFIYLWRKNQFAWSAVISAALWGLGLKLSYDWLQWQILFFVPGIIGYNLDSIRLKWNAETSHTRKYIKTILYAISAATLALSSYYVFGWSIVESPKTPVSYDSYILTRTWLDPIFSKNPLAAGRILLSFIWFAALLFIMRTYEKQLLKYTGWLLMPLGTFSLSSYVLHSFVVLAIQTFIPASTSHVVNTIIICCAVLFISATVSRPELRRFLLK